MPINVRWKDQTKTVLEFAYEGQWDLNDFYQSTEKGNRLLDEVKYPVNLVLDVTNSKTAPSGIMNAMSNNTRKLHPNTGIMVMVGVNIFARALIGMYFKIYPAMYKERPIYFAGNYDEAQIVMESFTVAKTKTVASQ